MKTMICAFCALASLALAAAPELKPLNILAFSKTEGFRHDSIPNAIKAFAEMANEHDWNITFTEDGAFFNTGVLDRMDVVVFIMTTGDILDEAQQDAFKAFIQRGGGFVAVHSGGTVTEYDWDWFRKMIAAKFTGHPPVCEGTLIVEDRDHPATRHFEHKEVIWEDEFYTFDRNPRDEVRVLISIDEDSYDIENNPWFDGVDLRMGDHPLVWSREFEGARIVQTSLGHTIEKYDDPRFRQHLAGSVKWVAGQED